MIDPEPLQLWEDLNYEEQSIEMAIWTVHIIPKATSELEEDMQGRYTHLSLIRNVHV